MLQKKVTEAFQRLALPLLKVDGTDNDTNDDDDGQVSSAAMWHSGAKNMVFFHTMWSI